MTFCSGVADTCVVIVLLIDCYFALWKTESLLKFLYLRLPRLREVGALLSPSTLSGEDNALHLLHARAALPHIRVETLIGSRANNEIQIKITIYFYKIMISYEKYATLKLY